MIATFSEAAQKAYPFAESFNAISPGIFYSTVVLGALCVLASILVALMTAGNKLAVGALGVAGILTVCSSLFSLSEIKGATIFDAPGVEVGAIEKVSVVRTAVFADEHSYVQFTDGTGLMFRGRPALPVGATVIKKANAWAGKDYYTVQMQAGEEPYYFTAR